MWDKKWRAADTEERMNMSLTETGSSAQLILDTGAQCGGTSTEEGKSERKKMTETSDWAKEHGGDDRQSRLEFEYTCTVLDVTCAWNYNW